MNIRIKHESSWECLTQWRHAIHCCFVTRGANRVSKVVRSNDACMRQGVPSPALRLLSYSASKVQRQAQDMRERRALPPPAALSNGHWSPMPCETPEAAPRRRHLPKHVVAHVARIPTRCSPPAMVRWPIPLLGAASCPTRPCSAPPICSMTRTGSGPRTCLMPDSHRINWD